MIVCICKYTETAESLINIIASNGLRFCIDDERRPLIIPTIHQWAMLSFLTTILFTILEKLNFPVKTIFHTSYLINEF